MLNLIAIAAGGALGALLRHGLAYSAQHWLGKGFPYGTLAVNIIGSFLIGAVYAALIERAALSEAWRSFLIIGLLGAFTTFSTFSFETVSLIQSGALIKAALNLLLSVGLCVGLCWLGILSGRLVAA